MNKQGLGVGLRVNNSVLAPPQLLCSCLAYPPSLAYRNQGPVA